MTFVPLSAEGDKPCPPDMLMDALAIVLWSDRTQGWHEPQVEEIRKRAREIVWAHAEHVIRRLLAAKASQD